MDFLNELFGSEMGELKRHQKTEEEIKKFSTSEDFTELKRAVHLLKKGYEIQKISVINHLDRYLLELGANELLLQIIIDSMTDWDYKMQIECANSFIGPIKLQLIDQKNLQKIVKFSIEILVSDEAAENVQLVEAWQNVFDVIVAFTDVQFSLKTIFPFFMDMPSLKNPLPKRKKGNRLLISFAKQIGEPGFDKEPSVLKLVQGICHDNNYKIRMDGVLFFKDYLQGEQRATILAHPRFKNIYLSELLELLNDEEAYIRIEALEILTDFLNFLSPEEIESEFVKEFLKSTEADVEEIQMRLAEIVGRIVYQLKPFSFHMKYREPILEFYKVMVAHKELKMRRLAAFNLPCFHDLYKNQDIQDEYDLDFNELYLKFAKEDDPQILKSVAASIHEAFKISTINQDTQKLRDAFKIIIEMNNREIISVISENMDISLLSYCNAHAVKTYAPLMGGLKEEVQQEIQYPLKKFLSMRPSKDDKKPLQKKTTALNLDKEEDIQPAVQLLPFVIPDNFSEIIYADMMSKLLIYDTNLQSAPGLWRHSIKYLRNLCKAIHLFNLPEFQEAFLASLFEYIKAGNAEIRQAAADCIARILEYQYNSAMRLELIAAIKNDLAGSSSCVLRKTFLFFCKSAVVTFSRAFFKQHFLQSYLTLSKDKVAAVRMEFAHSVVKIKPFLDYDHVLGNDLMSLLTGMHSDLDPDVVEAVQQSDMELLQLKKRTKEQEKLANQQDSERLSFEVSLAQREAKEEEERKKRNTDEEETKFDFALLETNKKFKRGKMNPFTLNGRKAGGNGVGLISSKPSNGTSGSLLSTSKAGQSSLLQAGSAIAGQTLQVPNSGSSLHQLNGDKTPSKKKPGSTSIGPAGIGHKKSELSTIGGGTLKGASSLSGNVLGYASGINQQNSSDKKSGNMLGIGSNDFAKRHSVLVTTSTQQLSGVSGLSTAQSISGAAKGGTNKSHLQARKPSFMNSDA